MALVHLEALGRHRSDEAYGGRFFLAAVRRVKQELREQLADPDAAVSLARHFLANPRNPREAGWLTSSGGVACRYPSMTYQQLRIARTLARQSELKFDGFHYEVRDKGLFLVVDHDHLLTVDNRCAAEVKREADRVARLAYTARLRQKNMPAIRALYNNAKINPMQLAKNGGTGYLQPVLAHYRPRYGDTARLVAAWRDLREGEGPSAIGLVGNGDNRLTWRFVSPWGRCRLFAAGRGQKYAG